MTGRQEALGRPGCHGPTWTGSVSQSVRRNLRPDLTGRTLLLHHGDVDCLALGQLGSLTVEGVFPGDSPGTVLVCGFWCGPDRVREVALVRTRIDVLPVNLRQVRQMIMDAGGR